MDRDDVRELYGFQKLPAQAIEDFGSARHTPSPRNRPACTAGCAQFLALVTAYQASLAFLTTKLLLANRKVAIKVAASSCKHVAGQPWCMAACL